MNYPTGLKKENSNTIIYSNRGQSLEDDLNVTNEYYLVISKAVIHKKPTPITIVNVDYKTRRDNVIREAYFKTPSTTDYNGIYKGKYIDFEAKETRSKTSFPLSNIHRHQLKHLNDIVSHGGIGFLIIRFTSLNLTYYLDSSKLLSFEKDQKRKSIPVSYFEKYGYKINDKYNPRVDYLNIVDEIYFGGENNE